MRKIVVALYLLTVCGALMASDKVLLVTGVEYPAHPWPQTAPHIHSLLEKAGFEVVATEDYSTIADMDLSTFKAVILHFQNPNPGTRDSAALDKLEAYALNGGGLLVTHFAIGAFGQCEQYQRIIGRVWNPKLRGHDPFGEFEMKVVPMDVLHPVAQNLPTVAVKDELYTCTDGFNNYEAVAAGISRVDGVAYPLVYIFRPGKGRSITFLLGHNMDSVGDVNYGKWLVRCVQFAAGQIPDSAASPERNQLSQENMEKMVFAVPQPEQNRIAELKNSAPDNAELVGYMNCGSYKTSLFGSVVFTVEPDAKPWNYIANREAASENGVKLSAVTSAPEIDGSVFFKPGGMDFTIKGIEKSGKYRLFVKWWDYDAGFRSQGIYCLSPDRRLVRRSLDPVALPNFTQMGAGAAIKSLLLPAAYSRNGELIVSIPAPGGPNAVVSEIWIYKLP